MDIKKTLAALMAWLLCSATGPLLAWQTLSKGLEYQIIQQGHPTPWSRIHAFRVDLKWQQLALATAKDLALPHAFINTLAVKNQALVAINGGFFDEQFRPLGLRVTQGIAKNPLKPISWWGVFYAKDQKAHVLNWHGFQAKEKGSHEQVELAIQSGPRLLINGEAPTLKPGRAERSALGIQKNGHVILVVTEHRALETRELAELMRAPPLNCLFALNLDGGHSSQAYAQIDSFHLSVPGFSEISDAIIVRPRLRD